MTVALMFVFAAALTGTWTVVAVEYCVKPSQPALEVVFDGGFPSSVHRVSVEPQCAENRTWNEYLAKQDHYFKSDVEFYFLPGVHFMNRSLRVRDASDISLYGKGPSSVTLTTDTTVHHPTSLMFTTFSRVAINGLKFTLCVSHAQASFRSILNLNSGTNMTIVNTVFQNTCNGGNIFGENLKNITMVNALFTDEAITFSHNVSGNIEIKTSRFVASTHLRGRPFIIFPSQEAINATVLIKGCIFSCGSVMFLNLESGTLILNDVHANGCQRTSPQGFILNGASGNCTITNSEFMGYDSAISIDFRTSAMLAHIENCSLHNNGVGNSALGSALTLISAEVTNQSHTISNVSFYDNG